MHGLHLVDQEIPYFQGRNVLWKYIMEMLYCTPYNFTSKTLRALTVYVSTSNKVNPVDNINWATSTFFTPKFAWVLDGRP